MKNGGCGFFMKNIYYFSVIFMILFLCAGWVSASDADIQGNNTLELTNIETIDEDSNLELEVSDDNCLCNDSSKEDANYLSSSSETSTEENVLASADDKYHFVFANVSKYDFEDYYYVKVVDSNGNNVSKGIVDFFINNTYVEGSYVDYYGVAYIKLNQYINDEGRYSITCLYSEDDYSSEIFFGNNSIIFGNVSLAERDIQILFEGVKIYDLNQKYSVRVLDSKGRPVSKGHVDFVFLNQMFYSTIDDEGYASFILPSDLEIVGHTYIGIIYDDDYLYSLTVTEQVTIGTRVLASLEEVSYASRMPKWNNYTYEFRDDGYYALIDDGLDYTLTNGFANRSTYHVIKFDGSSYIVHNVTINHGSSLADFFDILSGDDYRWDIIILNLYPGQGVSDAGQYSDVGDRMLNLYDGVDRPNDWSDREWDYHLHFTYGQLIINGYDGVILYGNRWHKNLMYVGYNANVVINNVGLYSFNHVFINHGSVICSNDSFVSNRAYAKDTGLESVGSVAQNFNSIVFNNCLFDNNRARIGDDTENVEGSILLAQANSKNVFINCSFSRGFKNSIHACTNSMITFFTDNPNIYENYFETSTFEMGASFNVISSDVLKENASQVVVFNCSSVEELLNAFLVINSVSPALEAVINLDPGEYILHMRDYDDGDYVPSMDWKVDWSIYDDGTFLNEDHYGRFLFNVGSVPVTINGNGATIRVVGTSEYNRLHFGVVTKYGSLTLNNLTLGRFNTAIFNYGTVIANNCVFYENKVDRDDIKEDKIKGGAFKCSGSSALFENCSFIDNEGNDHANAFHAIDSYLKFVNCTVGWSNGNSMKLGELDDSYVKVFDSYGLQFDSQGDSVVQYYRSEPGNIIYFNISDMDSLDNAYNTLVGDSYVDNAYNVFVLNFTNNCTFDFSRFSKFKCTLILKGNGFNIHFNSSFKIWSNANIYFMDIDFVGYDGKLFVNEGSCYFIDCDFINNGNYDEVMFETKGSCSIVNCSFIGNKGENVIKNSGLLSIVNCLFENNTYEDDGVIYNKEGVLLCANVTFNNPGEFDIYNFQTGDCAVLDSPAIIHYENPMPSWKLKVIKTTLLITAMAAGFATGFAIGAVIGPTIAALIFTCIAGFIEGSLIASHYLSIEEDTFRHSTSVLYNVLTILEFGIAAAGSAAQGFYLGSIVHENWDSIRDTLANLFGDNYEGVPGQQGNIIEGAINEQPGIGDGVHPMGAIIEDEPVLPIEENPVAGGGNEPLIPIGDDVGPNQPIIPADNPVPNQPIVPVNNNPVPNQPVLPIDINPVPVNQPVVPSQEELERAYSQFLRDAIDQDVLRVQNLHPKFQSLFERAMNTLTTFVRNNIVIPMNSLINLYFEFEETFALLDAVFIIEEEVDIDGPIEDIINSNNIVNGGNNIQTGADLMNSVINENPAGMVNQNIPNVVPNSNQALTRSPLYQLTAIGANRPAFMAIEDMVHFESMLFHSSYINYRNVSHIQRVINLYGQFCVLQRQVNSAFPNSMVGVPDDIIAPLNMFRNFLSNNQIGRSTLNNLLNDRNTRSLSVWESQLERALNSWNSFYGGLNQINSNPNVNLEDFNSLNKEVNSIFNQLKQRNLLQGQFEKVYQHYQECFIFEQDPNYKYDVDLLREDVYNYLIEIMKEENIDFAHWSEAQYGNAYDAAISYDYADFVMQNPLNGIFNRYNYVSSFKSIPIGFFKEIKNSLIILEQINPELHNTVMNRVFGGKLFDTWANDNGNYNMPLVKLQDVYFQIFEILGQNRINAQVLLNERLLNIYGIIYLDNFEDVYDLLSVPDRLIVNRYLYEQCLEGLKDYHVVDVSVTNYTFGKLSNIVHNLQNTNNVSSSYFKKLYEAYIKLMKGKNSSKIFNLTDVSKLSPEELGRILLKELPLFSLMHRGYSEYWPDYKISDLARHDVDFNLMNVIIQHMNNHDMQFLISLYESYKKSHNNLSICYELEYRTENLMPIDEKLVEGIKTNRELTRTIFSFYLDNAVYKMIPLVENIENTPYNDMVKIGVDISSSVPANLYIYNLLLMDSYNRTLFNFDLLKYLLSRFSADPEYHNPISFESYRDLLGNSSLILNGMTLDQIKSAQSKINKSKNSYAFNDIDVGNLDKIMKLLAGANYKAYFILSDYINSKFKNALEYKWNYDKAADEFFYMERNSEVKIYYSEFYENVLNKIKAIVSLLDLFNEDFVKETDYGALYFSKVYPLYIERWVDNNNQYNNIFNKLQFFKQVNNPTDDFTRYFVKTIDNDLIYLKNIDQNFYNRILIKYLDSYNSLDEMVKIKKYSYKDILKIYEKIYKDLSRCRDSKVVAQNEINVLINQLQSNEIVFLNSPDLKEKVRSYLLNYIYTWENGHMFPSPNERFRDYALRYNLDTSKNYTYATDLIKGLSSDLMDASLDKIFATYLEMRSKLFIGDVFLSDTFDSLDNLGEMRNVILNDLFRLQYGISNINDANIQLLIVEFFKQRGVDFYSQREWENYVNSLSSRNDLIQLYNTLHNILHRQNAAEAARIFMNIRNTLQEGQNDAAELINAWRLVENEHPAISFIISDRLLHNDLNVYIAAQGGAHNAYNGIMNFLETCLYNAGNVRIFNTFDDIQRIMRSQTIPYDSSNDEYRFNIIVLDEETRNFYGSLQSLLINYPEIGNDVLSNLMGDNPARFLDENEIAVVRERIINYIRQTHFSHEEEGVVDEKLSDDVNAAIKIEIAGNERVVIINGRFASQSSVEDIYNYIVNKVDNANQINNAGSSQLEILKIKAEEIYNNYANTNRLSGKGSMEKVINEKLNALKNNLLKILYQVDYLLNLDVDILEDMDDLAMFDDFIDMDVIDNPITQTHKFVKYPTKGLTIDEIVKNANNAKKQANRFCYSLESYSPLLSQFLKNHVDGWFSDFEKVLNTNDYNQISRAYSRVIDYMNILFDDILQRNFAKLSTDGLSKKEVVSFALSANTQANEYCIMIEEDNPELSAYLRNTANSLLNNFIEESNGDYALAYEKFIDKLNNLFRYISVVDRANFDIDNKVALESLYRVAIVYSMDISQYNPKLGQYLNAHITDYYKTLCSSGPISFKTYSDFANHMNELFRFDKTYSSIISFKFELQSTKNLDQDSIIILAKKDRDNAFKHADQIKSSNPNMASQLRKNINATYHSFIDSLKKIDPSVAYEVFIADLNMIFRDVRISDEANYAFELKSTNDLNDYQINKLMEEAYNKALEYRSVIGNGIFAPVFEQAISSLYNDYLKLSQKTNNPALAYENFIRELDRLFNFYTRQEESSVSMNLYDYIFNIPHITDENLNFDLAYLRALIYDDMNVLRVINPDLYNTFMKKYFNNSDSLENALNNIRDDLIFEENRYDEYISIYSNIYKELSAYRNNAVISNSEQLFIINLLKEGSGDSQLFSILQQNNKANVFSYIMDFILDNIRYFPDDASGFRLFCQNAVEDDVDDFNMLYNYYQDLLINMNQDIFNRDDFDTLNTQQMGDILMRELKILFSYDFYNRKLISSYFGFKVNRYGPEVQATIMNLVNTKNTKELISIYQKARSIFKEVYPLFIVKKAIASKQPIDENLNPADKVRIISIIVNSFFFDGKNQSAFRSFIGKIQVPIDFILKVVIKAHNYRITHPDVDPYKLIEGILVENPVYLDIGADSQNDNFAANARHFLDKALSYCNGISKTDQYNAAAIVNHINSLYKKFIVEPAVVSSQNFTNFANNISDLFMRYENYIGTSKEILNNITESIKESNNFAESWNLLKEKYPNVIPRLEHEIFSDSSIAEYINNHGEAGIRDIFLNKIAELKMGLLLSWMQGPFAIQ